MIGEMGGITVLLKFVNGAFHHSRALREPVHVQISIYFRILFLLLTPQ